MSSIYYLPCVSSILSLWSVHFSMTCVLLYSLMWATYYMWVLWVPSIVSLTYILLCLAVLCVQQHFTFLWTYMYVLCSVMLLFCDIHNILWLTLSSMILLSCVYSNTLYFMVDIFLMHCIFLMTHCALLWSLSSLRHGINWYGVSMDALFWKGGRVRGRLRSATPGFRSLRLIAKALGSTLRSSHLAMVIPG